MGAGFGGKHFHDGLVEMRIPWVGMTLLFGVLVLDGEFGSADGRTADPSTALRSGRDDKGEGYASIQIRYWDDEQQVPPLVGMTLLFGG